jgi:hypothetical protein
MVVARLAAGANATQAAGEAVFVQGRLADAWPATTALTAASLALGQG